MNDLLWPITVGIVAGFLAGKVMKGKGFCLIFNLLVGVGGAILGGWLFGQFGISVGTGLVRRAPPQPKTSKRLARQFAHACLPVAGRH